MRSHPAIALLSLLSLAAGLPAAAGPLGHLETEGLPSRLRDRGPGQPTSMFGTYVQAGQLLVYPFVEGYVDGDAEYKPEDFGYAGDVDYRGEYRALEGLLFVAYGFSDRFAVELEAAFIDARLDKATGDPSAQPARLRESGLGDVEGQLRWRWNREREGRPELFGYFETVFPTADAGSLIGTADWELKFGSGLVRGFAPGTFTLRAAVEYDAAEGVVELGEIAVEYLRRLSARARLYLGVEGTQDEWEMIPEFQWHPSPRIMLKANSAIGLTSKATDWAPELGVMFSF